MNKHQTILSTILLFLLFLSYISCNKKNAKLPAAPTASICLDTAPEKLASCLRGHLRDSFEHYNGLIRNTHIDEHGLLMLSIDERGRQHDQCDTILFSAVYAKSLSMAGYKKEALEVARAVSRLFSSGSSTFFIRHPECLNTPLSRDMTMGLLLAWTIDPGEFLGDIIGFQQRLSSQGGFIDERGSIFQSFSSPTINKLLSRIYILARLKSLNKNLMPHPPLNSKFLIDEESGPFNKISFGAKKFRALGIKSNWVPSFYTNDLNVIFANSGYQSHLVGLAVWMAEDLESSISSFNDPKLIGLKENFGHAVFRLHKRDPRNLFYKALNSLRRSRNNGPVQPINIKAAAGITGELLSPPYYYVDRQPTSCDRYADYVWQRSFESRFVGIDKLPLCRWTYSGVDFLWINAMILRYLDGE